MASLTIEQRNSIAAVRGVILGAKSSLSVSQNRSLATANTDVPWTVKTTFTVLKNEQDGIRDLIDEAIRKYGRGHESYTQPSIDPIDAWWTTYDDGGAYSSSTTGRERYDQVMRSINSDTIIMYFHGGGFM